jgi:Tol biopolymer transport system component
VTNRTLQAAGRAGRAPPVARIEYHHHLVWRPILLCVVFSGCGFRASVGPDGGAHEDASGPRDGAIDGTVGATGCLAHWLDGSVAISVPQELATLSTAGSERDPWISSDRLTLYYGVDPTGAVTSQIYRATRASTTQPFGSATAQVNLNRTDADQSRPALTPDEKMLVLASNRAGGTKFDIYLTTRTDTALAFGSPDTSHLGNVNAGTASTFDPYLTADGLKLYLAPFPGASLQHIFVATRPDTSSDFSTPGAVPGINSQSTDADPALSLDERIIVFSSTRNGGAGKADLWYATRSSTAANFNTPKLIPTANGSADDGDPMLSADGCELYFSSTRNGGNYNLYVAQITP